MVGHLIIVHVHRIFWGQCIAGEPAEDSTTTRKSTKCRSNCKNWTEKNGGPTKGIPQVFTVYFINTHPAIFGFALENSQTSLLQGLG